jgi:hypothetical protein
MDDNDLKGRFEGIATRFTEVDARFNEMRQLILDEGKRTRSHFDVVAEGLKDEIKVIAEGHVTLIAHNATVDSQLQRLEMGQDRIELRVLAIESRVGSVESRVGSVESRVGSMEKTQKVVLTEVRGLAMKVDGLSPRHQPRRRRT